MDRLNESDGHKESLYPLLWFPLDPDGEDAAGEPPFPGGRPGLPDEGDLHRGPGRAGGVSQGNEISVTP